LNKYMKINKAVIPAAGFGTRFLPQTKAMPKEMLPIVDKPVIQYVVEEAVTAGIEDIIMVTGWHKRAIEDHFDYPFELEKRLEEWGKQDRIEGLRKIADLANFIYVRQKGPYGNATPIKSVEHLIKDDPFLVLWGDDFMLASPTRAKQLIDAYHTYESPILCGIITDNPDDGDRYAFVEGQDLGNGTWKVNRLIEKPGKGKAPSRLAVVSGYVLTPQIFPILKTQMPGKGGEYYLPEAIDTLAKEHPIYAIEVQNGKYYDTGNKLEYMKTVVDLALRHPEISQDFRAFLKSINI